VQRRLSAILIADVVGYSRLMEADEAGTLSALKERRAGILETVVKVHVGRVGKLMGDGVLVGRCPIKTKRCAAIPKRPIGYGT
jgi:class 3 adenylate cyclase